MIVLPAPFHRRRALLGAFDTLRRDIDAGGRPDGMDAFTARALDLVTSARVREAFDVSREPEPVRQSYGPVVQVKSATEGRLVPWDPLPFLQARR